MMDTISAAELAQTAVHRPTILDPLLARAGQGLVYGPAGVGKSWLALGLAYAAAAGTRFLRWRATRPHQVVYVDGEMGPAELQRRLALFGPPPTGLTLSLPRLEDGSPLDLAHSDGVAWTAVIRSASMRRASSVGSRTSSAVASTTVPPARNGPSSSRTEMSNDSVVTASSRSPAATGRAARNASRLRWLTTTPFGRPVEPEV